MPQAGHFGVGRHESARRAGVIPSPEVVEARFAIAFFAGEMHRTDVAAGAGDGLAVTEGQARDLLAGSPAEVYPRPLRT